MQCRIVDLRCKEVIDIHNGLRLGFVSDVILDVVTGCLIAIVVPGPCRFLGLFWREDDFVIPFDCIRRIGDDIILIDVDGEYRREKRRRMGWV